MVQRQDSPEFSVQNPGSRIEDGDGGHGETRIRKLETTTGTADEHRRTKSDVRCKMLEVRSSGPEPPNPGTREPVDGGSR
jgi:hypothetical protein